MTAKRLSIGIDKDLYDWLEAQIGKGVFYNRRHGIEVALKRLKESSDRSEANKP